MGKASLKENLAGLIHDIFKAAGMPITIHNQEKLEVVAPRFAEAVKQEARNTSLVLAKKLQEATIDGFNNFAKELDTLKAEVGRLKDEIQRLVEADNKRTGDGK